mmetsp:Transcript_38371/g.89739  ORF Transcript_38371/g.89739 Transcript_38371/m.89739 type:complete len:209 (-) Transcript_38371:160-786(-)
MFGASSAAVGRGGCRRVFGFTNSGNTVCPTRRTDAPSTGSMVSIEMTMVSHGMRRVFLSRTPVAKVGECSEDASSETTRVDASSDPFGSHTVSVTIVTVTPSGRKRAASMTTTMSSPPVIMGPRHWSMSSGGGNQGRCAGRSLSPSRRVGAMAFQALSYSLRSCSVSTSSLPKSFSRSFKNSERDFFRYTAFMTVEANNCDADAKLGF